ncbi:hypothetical protein UFOVP1261_15 [uncultured Caudovirales phage]|uniref:Uncharacterized protein n=1 Tax=uncultured Caudovirales phage TaxID=2100421 RepID=A0A6J5T4I9_9CAUD|nr:hypothetical protein UFOVP1261_15 [uncultured Caudovirales phage]CAB4221951.1 hypothetical protein UFOVP1650_3 [uncultured Caudovirales phage]
MGHLQIHTVDGWKDLGDVIPARIKCDKCGEIGVAQGAGFVKCDPPELLVYLCATCR